MKITTIEIMAFFSSYLYNIFLINHYEGIVNLKIDIKKALLIFPMVVSIIVTIIIIKKVVLLDAYIIIFFVYIIMFKIIFDETLSSIYMLSIYQIFQIIINKDIIVGIIALINKKSMCEIIQNYNMHLFILILTRIIMCFLLIKVFNKPFYKNSLKKIILYRKKLIANILTTSSLTIILIASNDTHHFFSYINTSTYITLINRICIYFCFYFVFYMAIKSIRWVEEEVLYKTNLLSVEYNENISKRIDEYTNLLKMYNHDFKSILVNINDSIEMGDLEKAKRIITEFNSQIKGFTKKVEKFSNDILINAIFTRLNENCSDNKIFFKAECYIPNKIAISELDLVKIFNNLSSNAFEACIKQNSYEKKYIIFKSYVKENSFVIYQTNSFNGEIKMRNNRLITTKKDKQFHGIGVESIKYVVNEANGMVIIKVDKDKKEFRFLIKIPLIKNE